MSHLVPQPPPWAVAWSSAALSSRLSCVSHLRMQVQSQTARRRPASGHLCSSQGGQLSSQGSLLAGRRVNPHCVRQLCRVGFHKKAVLPLRSHLKLTQSSPGLPMARALSFQPHSAYPEPHRPHKGHHRLRQPWLGAPRCLKFKSGQAIFQKLLKDRIL